MPPEETPTPTPTPEPTPTPDPPKEGLAAALGDGKGTPPVAPVAAAPESYSPWKLPDGYELDTKASEEAAPIFKELNLSQDQAQKLVDFYAKHSLKSAEDTMAQWMETRKGWREDLKADPTMSKLVGSNGNFGPDSPLVVTVNRALDGLQNPKLVSDFKEAMELTGAGDHPAFVKVLHALASKVTEGTSYPTGNPPAGANRRPTAAAALFPDLPSAQGR